MKQMARRGLRLGRVGGRIWLGLHVSFDIHKTFLGQGLNVTDLGIDDRGYWKCYTGPNDVLLNKK
jgi:hypothetical protein